MAGRICSLIGAVSLVGLLSGLAPTVWAGGQSVGDSAPRQITLQTEKGEQLTIGQLLLSPAGEGYRAEVKMDDDVYGDYFLSMRPFKCLESEKQLLCHLPYPYQNAQQISHDDLIDLEYQLLFIRKVPTDYGINPWFGVYYKLQWENPPHGPITGQLHETNMDILAAPPEDPTTKPITADELYEADLAEHWLPTLIIR